MLLNGVIADGYFYSAHAQCGVGDKIYIDPRLVPGQPQITPAQITAFMVSEDISSADKTKLWMMYRQQDQPIEVPFGTGKVLVNPINPCIQQYIP